MRKSFLIICIYFLSFFFCGCFNLLEDKKTSTSIEKRFPNVEGRITPGSGVDISKIRVGLFFRSSIEGISSQKLEFDGLKGRMYFMNNSNKGAVYTFAPSLVGFISSNGDYFINFADTSSMVQGDLYYLVTWYDADDDYRIKLLAEGSQIDETKPALTYANSGEFNRVPVVSVTYLSAPTDVYAGYFANKLGTSSYFFKYYGVSPFFDDNNNSFDNTKTLTTTNNTGFNFNISSTLDSN